MISGAICKNIPYSGSENYLYMEQTDFLQKQSGLWSVYAEAQADVFLFLFFFQNGFTFLLKK